MAQETRQNLETHVSVDTSAQEAPAILQVSSLDALLGVIAVLIGMGVAWGTLRANLINVSNTLNNQVLPDLKDVRERFLILEGKTSNLFKAASPVRLTEPGEKVLEETGLKAHLDKDKEMFVTFCQGRGEMQNPYDVQMAVFDMFDNYSFYPEMEEKLKTYAYEHGIPLHVIKRIAAIYFRDICISELGMNPKEIDKFDPAKNQ